MSFTVDTIGVPVLCSNCGTKIAHVIDTLIHIRVYTKPYDQNVVTQGPTSISCRKCGVLTPIVVSGGVKCEESKVSGSRAIAMAFGAR